MIGQCRVYVYVYSLYVCPAYHNFELFRIIDLVAYSACHVINTVYMTTLKSTKIRGDRVYSAYRVLGGLFLTKTNTVYNTSAELICLK